MLTFITPLGWLVAGIFALWFIGTRRSRFDRWPDRVSRPTAYRWAKKADDAYDTEF